MIMRFVLLLITLFLTFNLSAQKKKDKKEEDTTWKVAAPGKDFKYKPHSFTTTEGT